MYKCIFLNYYVSLKIAFIESLVATAKIGTAIENHVCYIVGH